MTLLGVKVLNCCIRVNNEKSRHGEAVPRGQTFRYSFGSHPFIEGLSTAPVNPIIIWRSDWAQ
jgi:hypothetical protein